VEIKVIKNFAGETTGASNRHSNVTERRLSAGRSAALKGSVAQHGVGPNVEQMKQMKQSSEFCDRQWDLHDLLDALPAAIYTTDAAGRITFFNQAAVELSGRTPEIGSDRWCVAWRLYWPDGRPMAHDECPMAKALKEDRPIRDGEAIAERPDGTRVPFQAYPTPLHDDSGRLVGAVNMLVDLTAAKEADEARSRLNETLEQRVEETRQLTEALTRARESERRFRLFVGAVTDYAIYMLDTEGVIINWNAGAERITGYRSEEIIGRHFSVFYIPKDQEDGLPHRALMITARDGRFVAEGWRVRKNGSRFWANVVIHAVHDDAGVLIGFAKITRDMTESRAADEQLRQSQKMEAVGQLTNGVAHDFNNLLATIIPNLELAEPNIKDKRVLKYLENAIRAAERAAQLTNQLLTFSRRQELSTEPVDVNQLVTEACEMLPRTIGPTIAIATVLDEDAWPAMTEPGQLELAILNLAINARDAMLAGGKLTITTKNMARGIGRRIPPLDLGDYVMISVADTGTGMSEEVRSRAFEPFFTTKEVHKGTGLGLSMVYGFARQSGGTVTIESEIGKGTTLRIYLPRAPHRLEVADEMEEQNQWNAGPPSRILMVDDNSAVRAITAIMLRTLGHDAIEAASGQEALDLLEQDPLVDLLIIDLAMPNMHGDEFAMRARELIPGVPMLFVTGYAEPGRVKQKTEGEIEILKKPFRRAQLAEKLRHILRISSRRHGRPIQRSERRQTQ
jgi:PAS domain S-box-containing protein